MGKGNKQRPPQISKEEEDLRWTLALGKIDREYFDTCLQMLKEQGKIYRRARYKLNQVTGE